MDRPVNPKWNTVLTYQPLIIFFFDEKTLNLWQHGTERYLTSGSLHRTRQDKGSHMLTVITVNLSFITQFHPHPLVIPRFFPKDPQNRWGPQNNKIVISLVQLKYPLKTREDLDQIFHEHCHRTSETIMVRNTAKVKFICSRRTKGEIRGIEM